MHYELIQNQVRICLDDECGEGYHGDYDPNDPEDEMLLRFSVDKFEGGFWAGIDNASYCTLLPSSLDNKLAHKFLQVLMQEVYDVVMDGNSIKKTCERLSWTAPKDLV